MHRYSQARKEDVQLKYVLLNPAIHFADVLTSAHAVIVAGGTMAPVVDLLQHLMITAARPKVRPMFAHRFAISIYVMH